MPTPLAINAPIPSPLGTPVPSRTLFGLKLHSVPSLASPSTVIPAGAAVTVYSAPLTSADGYTFAFVDWAANKGYAAVDAGTNHAPSFDPAMLMPAPTPSPVPVPPLWTVSLDVPYVSQLGTQAALSNNDCGVAALLMLERFWFQQHGLSTPIIPDVDDLERRTPLAQPNPPKGLTFADLQQVALLTGFQTHYAQPMTPDKIVESLGAGVPVLALVDYRTYNPKSTTTFAHFMIVKGYNADAFLTADPYSGGNNVIVPRAQLDAAMKSVPGNAGSYQALVLA